MVLPARRLPDHRAALRERREDILLLAEHFLEMHGTRESKPGCRLARPAAHLLLAYDWPGNVRELENEMQRAMALAEPGSLSGPRFVNRQRRSVTPP